ncbi:MAG: hypothetical protein LUE18_05930 [Akkermansia sp.]|nr:hypothetical protein [Akkermansia sp.]
MGRNEADHSCYSEARKILNPDGMALTTIRLRKIKDSMPFFEKEIHRAVFPYLFVDSLADIVDKKDEQLYFIFRDTDFFSRELSGIYMRTRLLHSRQLVPEDVPYSNPRPGKNR